MQKTVYFSPDGWNEDMVGVGLGNDQRWVVFLKGGPEEMTPHEARELADCLLEAANEAVRLNAQCGQVREVTG